MMDNLAANKSHIPCEGRAGQNGWSTNSTQGPLFNPLPNSQRLSLGLPSDQRPSCDLQAPNLSCMNNIGTLSSTHHSALYKVSHISSNSSSTSLFANTAIPSVSFSQQSPYNLSAMLTANQGKNVTPLSFPQTNQAPQPCRPQHLPLLSPHNPYKASPQPPLTNQTVPNGVQDMPISLPSCGQRGSTSQSSFEGANARFAGGSGYTHSHASSTSQEQCQLSHCRAAVKESVPDGAAHPNKEPSQPSSNDRQRSVLLQQRAQLLQKLAELDFLLESIPAKDSSDGQSAHTADQSPPSMDVSSQCEQIKTSDANQVELSAEKSKSQSDLSVDCSSPVSYDEESGTCDTPGNPMSAAESVVGMAHGQLQKEENPSAESEDESDPDYSPESDGGCSDVPSDSDLGSSDESSHSSPSTPTDKRPSRQGKKRPKSGSSLIKAKCVSLPKETPAATQKKSSETVVLPCSYSEKKRVYDRRNYCLYCSKPQSKIARHLMTVHSDKTEVAAAFQYPKNSRERQKIWNRLRKEGNFAHNKAVLKAGKGHLAVGKRPRHTGKAKDFVHCLHCRGLYLKKALYRHMRLCPEKGRNGSESRIGRKRIALQCVLETSEDLGITDGFKSVLSQMTYDDVTMAVMDDKVILQFGELLFNQYGSDERKHDYIRQNLRQVARLVLEAQKLTPLKKLEDFFVPSNFPHVVAAVNVLAGYDPDTKTYSIPSLAIKLGYHLQKTCSIVEGNAIECGDASLAESAQNFLSVYQKEWNRLISSGALTTLRETKSNTDKKVPFAQDVKRLNFHLENVHLLAEKKLRESPSADNYAALTRVLLARTILFNRRSAREVSLVQLAAFMSRKKTNVDTGMDVTVSNLERTMCAFFTRIDIRGKCGRLVPILLKPSFVSAMELFVKARETCGVPTKNLYLFGRPNALTSYNGSECIQKYVRECGAQDPKALTSAKIRKHYATMLQVMNLDEDEAVQILGPNNQRDRVIQLDDVDMDSDERLQPARGQHAASWDHSDRPGARYGPAEFYHEQAHGATTGANMTVPPTSFNSGKKERLQPSRGQQAASWDHSDHPGARYGPAEFYHEQAHGATTGANMTVPPTSFNSGKKAAQNQGKHKWEEAEVQAVERHLMRLIHEHKVPQKNDCIQCLEAEPEALKNRSWKGVKDYVRNRITALKRQRKTSQATSTNNNWTGQEEQQEQQDFQFFWTE